MHNKKFQRTQKAAPLIFGVQRIEMKKEEIRKLKLQNWPLPNDYLTELGRVSALWASLESFLNLCIGKLAGFNELADPKPFILVHHSSFPQRLDMLGALCEQLIADFPNLKDYKGVIGKLKSAQKLRNRYMHYGMSPNPDTGDIEMAIGSARGKLKTSVEKIDIADIRSVSMEIHQANIDLYKLVLGHQLTPIWERRSAEHGA